MKVWEYTGFRMASFSIDVFKALYATNGSKLYMTY